MSRSTTRFCPTCTIDGAADVERGLPALGADALDALNQALRGIPKERSRYHICWGSWNGPHAFDVPLKDIIDLVLQVRVGHYSFEAANPRHAHEWRVWETVKLRPGQALDSRRYQPRHQHRRTSRTGGGADRAPRQDRRAKTSWAAPIAVLHKARSRGAFTLRSCGRN